MSIHLEWLLNPLTVYAMAAAALTLSLTLFVGIKRELAKALALAEESQSLWDAERMLIPGMQSEFETMRDILRKLEAAPPPPLPRIGPGIEFTKRAQALRMRHRGETPASIAAAMESPVNEIELMLKVQALTGPAETVSVEATAAPEHRSCCHSRLSLAKTRRAGPK